MESKIGNVLRVIILVIIIMAIGFGSAMINKIIWDKPPGVQYIEAVTLNQVPVILFCTEADRVDEAIAVTKSKVVRTIEDVKGLALLLSEYGVEQINFRSLFIEMILEGDL